ncbi:AAA family ATPase [Nodosilinea sp. PGN35]|uniref:AAA family ATPase n=1 Tax=Nodosilinea sp. PGN35 TaxID=3020489 RepID=UPI0023B2D3A2|nr:ATP-binding protein [Nodosilinea sp. TSF1-S3]
MTDSNQFAEVGEFWDLGRLHTDLSQAKSISDRSPGHQLSKAERLYLHGVLSNCSPKEIAQRCVVADGTVRSCLSDRIYPYVKLLVYQKTGVEAEITHWSKVAQLLEQLGYKRQLQSAEPVELPSSWVGAPTPDKLFGRDDLLNELAQAIAAQNQRILHLTGAEGMGKTSLAVQLARQLAEEQHYAVFWISIATTPSIPTWLDKIQRLWGIQTQLATPTLEATFAALLQQVSSSPWLIVLDAMETLLDRGKFLPAYQDYSPLFRQLCELDHRGAMIVTSSEPITNLSVLEGRGLPVQSVRVEGLSVQDTGKLLKHLQLRVDNAKDLGQVVQTYSGNPQFIRLLAPNIKDIFDGSLTALAQLNTVFLNQPMRNLIEGQWQRLTPIEQQIAQCLARAGASLSMQELQSGLPKGTRYSDLVAGLQGLRERSLIELITGPSQDAPQYQLQSAVKKYLSS